jgi:hypothetical protein
MSVPVSNDVNEDAKISHPKYWLTIILVALAAVLLNRIPYVYMVLWLVVIVICFLTISKMKTRGIDRLVSSEKYKMTFFMAFDPLIAQALYYYRLRKSLPETASKALKIGWKTFILQVISFIILTAGLIAAAAALGGSGPAWNRTYGPQFSSGMSAVNTDLRSIFQDVKTNNSVALRTDCQQVKTDVGSLQALPKHPVQATNAQISKTVSDLAQAADDCVGAASQSPVNVTLLNKSGTEFIAALDESAAIKPLISATK